MQTVWRNYWHLYRLIILKKRQMIIEKKLSPKGILKKSQDLIRQRDIIDMLSIFWIVIYVV
jgi:hypothetical protein